MRATHTHSHIELPPAPTCTTRPGLASHERLRLACLPRCQHGSEGGLANSDAAAGELGMGAMTAGERQQGTSLRWRPLIDRRAFATSHVSQGYHGTFQLMSPPCAHVRVKALSKSARGVRRCSYNYHTFPRAPKTDESILCPFPPMSFPTWMIFLRLEIHLPYASQLFAHRLSLAHLNALCISLFCTRHMHLHAA